MRVAMVVEAIQQEGMQWADKRAAAVRRADMRDANVSDAVTAADTETDAAGIMQVLDTTTDAMARIMDRPSPLV
jgi:hypothetical protein